MRVGRSSLTGWCRRRGTCCWLGGSSGWVRPGLVKWCGSGPTADLIHLFAGGTRVKTVRSHLSVNDLAKLTAAGAVPAGPSPLPPVEDGDAVEVERCVNSFGLVSLGGHRLLAAEILAGRQVGIRIEATLLLFYDLHTRELLRTRANPLTPEQIKRLRGVRPAGPPPRPSTEPIRVQRRASATGVIVVAGQKVALGPDPPASNRHRARIGDRPGHRVRRR